MSTSPSDSGSYVRRNLPLLIVGAAAIAGIIAIVAVAIDQVREDDDEALVAAPRAFFESGRRDGFRDGVGRLEELFGNGLLLGVSLDETDDGLFVQNVVDGSPADDAGIEVGDDIREIDGDRVRTVEELREAIAAIDVGDEYELTVRRAGDTRTLTVRRGLDAAAAVAELLERLKAEGFDLDQRRFGSGGGFDFDFGSPQPRGQFDSTPRLDPFAASRLRPALGVSVVQTNEGLRVVGVEAGSVADEAGLEADDIILEADGTPVNSIEALRAALPSTRIEPDRSSIVTVVELLVRRSDRELTLEARFAQASTGPAAPLDTSPSLPNATPEPDRSTDRRAPGSANASPSDTPTPAATAAAVAVSSDLDDLDVFRGTVEVLTDSQITLGGPRGAISFALTEDTAIVGGEPSVGRTSSVAANADREAVLVLTVG